MQKVLTLLKSMNEEQLANTFDIVASLPVSKEGNIVLETIMSILENKDGYKFKQWLMQSNGAALSNYFH
jgi:hypothetical protein